MNISMHVYLPVYISMFYWQDTGFSPKDTHLTLTAHHAKSEVCLSETMENKFTA